VLLQFTVPNCIFGIFKLFLNGTSFSVLEWSTFSELEWLITSTQVEQFVPCRGHFLDLSLIGSFGNVKHMSFKKDPFESFNFVLNQYNLPSCTTHTSLPLTKNIEGLNVTECQNTLYEMPTFILTGKSYSRYEGGARKVLGSCEMYDPDTDRWTYIAPMAQCRCLFGAEVF
jgi:hypothetical protein